MGGEKMESCQKVGGQKERNKSQISHRRAKFEFQLALPELVLVVFKNFPPHIRSIGSKDDGILGTGATGDPTYLWEPNCVFCGVEPTLRGGHGFTGSGEMVKCDTVGYLRLTDLAGSLEVVRRQF